MELPCRVLFGAVPRDLRGFYYRNGPDTTTRQFAHPLDGDGRVDRVRIEDGRVTVLSKPVWTRERKLELLGVQFRHVFGTNRAWPTRLKNCANTSVASHGGTLLALWEGAVPYALCPKTLKTLGTHTLGGHVRDALPAPVFGGEAVCAHTHVDPRAGSMVFLASQFGPTHTRMRFLELSEDFTLRREAVLSVKGFSLAHDFALTEKHIVLFAPALAFDVPRYVFGVRSAAECVQHTKAGTRVFVVDRASGECICSTTTRRFFPTHAINAFDTADGVTVDTVMCPELTIARLPEFSPFRIAVNVDRGSVSFDRIADVVVEMPTVAPNAVGRASYRFAYGVGPSPCGAMLGAWIKMDIPKQATTHLTVSPSVLHFEPQFVPRDDGHEDDGYLVGFLYDMQTGAPLFAVADARTMRVLCVAEAIGCNAFGLHGMFVRHM